MHSREVVDVLADDDTEVLEAHPVEALVDGRDELDERDRGPVEEIERLGEHDLGDRAPVPDVLAVRPRMALEKRALVDVEVPIGDTNGDVAERIRRDVDAAGNETVALHRGEGSIVPDDLGDGVRRRHVASSAAIVRVFPRVRMASRQRGSPWFPIGGALGWTASEMCRRVWLISPPSFG